ncbi:MAG: glycosyltransferase family 39 protein [Ardenticatenia bacterium]|nr:glycosyltransferase family 39 protein [Ardenticatenia bacterium]
MLLLILVGAAVRAYRLGADSLWYDETVSLLLAGKPVPALVAHTARDIHPPFYYLVLRFWTLLAGRSEMAAAWLSYAAGLLLLPATYALVIRVTRRGDVALGAVALMAISPYHVWYAQEVRMYTLGALLAVLGGRAAWTLLDDTLRHGGEPVSSSAWRTLVVTSALGLYTLYYYAFWLMTLAGVVVGVLAVEGWRRGQRIWALLRPWAKAAMLTLLLWFPWIPVAYRQAVDPPVPPWRQWTPLAELARESFAALAFGQSVRPEAIPGWLAVALLLYGLGLLRLATHPRLRHPVRATVFFAAWTWGPLLLIVFFSLFQPLYHVRYVFTYSPPFYAVVAAGSLALLEVAWRAQRTARARVPLYPAVLVLVALFWAGTSAYSLRRFWHDPRYRADDFRGAVARLEANWHPGDALLINAGYVYPAFNYYFRGPVAWQGRVVNYRGWPNEAEGEGLVVLQTGSLEGSPSLGWGRPESDFYLTGEAETAAALERVAQQHPRLWVLRAYDTVTDPNGFVRRWLEERGLLFYDEQLTGPSNIRLQGWLMPAAFGAAPTMEVVAQFMAPESNVPLVRLEGVARPPGRLRGGENLYLTFYVQPLPDLQGPLRLSAGLFDATGRQWAVEDRAPLGPLLTLADVQGRGAVAVPVRLSLPPGLPPGNYEVRLKLYRPVDGRSLVPAGETIVPPDQVRTVLVEVLPTLATVPAPAAERSLNEVAGPPPAAGCYPAQAFFPAG